MKILVVSLLRLGDILLSSSVLRSLRLKYPKSEIHILINGQFLSVAEMIPFVDKVYTFDRDGIQQIIGSLDRNLLEAYFRIEDVCERLQGEKYDKVINLTHNRLSGWLTALIACPDTKGIMFGSEGKFSVGSNWFEYLNDIVEAGRVNTFHFVDVFHYGTGILSSDRRIELKETQAGVLYAESVLETFAGKTIVAIQPFSSEQKKTFSKDKWVEIIRTVKRLDDSVEVIIFGAPNEAASAQEIATLSGCVAVISGLAETFSILNRISLLITGDTSIKHLAAAVPAIKVLEISLGSSEYLKTGVYKDGAVIIQGITPCYPCSHRSSCTQPTHECADKVTPELVAMVATTMLRQDESGLRLLAHEDRESVIIAKTCINVNGDWSAFPIGSKLSALEINSWVDRASFKLYLQGAHRQQIGEFGTEGLQLKHLLEKMFPEHSKQEWSQELLSLEKDYQWFESQLIVFLDKLKTLLSHYDDEVKLKEFVDELEKFCTKTSKSHFSTYGQQITWTLKDSTIEENPFEVIKRLRVKLTNAHQRAKIEIKLIRGLQTHFKEAL